VLEKIREARATRERITSAIEGKRGLVRDAVGYVLYEVTGDDVLTHADECSCYMCKFTSELTDHVVTSLAGAARDVI
jgi:hypothetical protein